MEVQAFMPLQATKGPVVCLGVPFKDDGARREHYSIRLREHLESAHPKREGAEIEAIIGLSDPPYYTACENPFLSEVVASWTHVESIHRESYSAAPLAVDVTVGKQDPVYKAHSYHTKVPHLAIVPSILHYTQPGDIVLDGFAGSGMTGVAVQWCGVAPEAYRREIEAEWKDEGRKAPTWGARRVILNDLSPAATFLESNYNLPIAPSVLVESIDRVLMELETRCGWMYQTEHGEAVGKTEFMVWSEVFTCPQCAGEITFTDAALCEDNEILKEFDCNHCGLVVTKRSLNRVFVAQVDPITGEQVRSIKFVPVEIHYRYRRADYIKQPSAIDLDILRRIDTTPIPNVIRGKRFPIEKMYHGSRLAPKGFHWVHQLYTRRALIALGTLAQIIDQVRDAALRRVLLALVYHQTVNASLRNSYRPGASFGNRAITGVYYVSSMPAEASVLSLVNGTAKRLKQLSKTPWVKFSRDNVCITTGGAARLNAVPDGSIDYIFTDPPFGSNIFYADLNISYESWLGVYSDPEGEAIVDPFKDKNLEDYFNLMTLAFSEYFRVLRPGRWMTVVFSNSKASVWNSIQVALQRAGFVVSEVTALDKSQGSYRQVTSPNAVKQDLVVSCYRPNGGLEDRFEARGLTEDTAWDFIRTHLKNLTVLKRSKSGGLEMVAERDPRRLFDRMVAWFVRHNTPVPLSMVEFQVGLTGRFPERDGMYFLPNQIDEYDKARMQAGDPPQRDLFVDDERTAIDWLTDFLRAKPSTYQEVHPEFTQKTGAGWRRHELKPELLRLLDENFLKFDGSGAVPSQIHAYLSSNWKELRNLDKDDPQLVGKARNRWFVPDPNKQQDVEARREKALLREFDIYRAHQGKKMKEIRLEVMRVGFKAAWAAKDYRTIIDVSAKVPDEVWQEDERLMMLHSMAETRLEAER